MGHRAAFVAISSLRTDGDMGSRTPQGRACVGATPQPRLSPGTAAECPPVPGAGMRSRWAGHVQIPFNRTLKFYLFS